MAELYQLAVLSTKLHLLSETAYYIAEIQPYISLLNQQSTKIFSNIKGIYSKPKNHSQQKSLHVFFESIYGNRDNQKTASTEKFFDQAIKQHTRAWQSLLTDCDLMPKVPVS